MLLFVTYVALLAYLHTRIPQIVDFCSVAGPKVQAMYTKATTESFSAVQFFRVRYYELFLLACLIATFGGIVLLVVGSIKIGVTLWSLAAVASLDKLVEIYFHKVHI